MTLGTICITREVVHKLQEQLFFVDQKKKKKEKKINLFCFFFIYAKNCNLN